MVEHLNDEISGLVAVGLVGVLVHDGQISRKNVGIALERVLVDRQRHTRRDFVSGDDDLRIGRHRDWLARCGRAGRHDGLHHRLRRIGRVGGPNDH